MRGIPLDARGNLTLFIAASSPAMLAIMLWIAVIGIPFVLVCRRDLRARPLDGAAGLLRET